MFWFFFWKLPFLLCLIGFLALIIDGIHTFKMNYSSSSSKRETSLAIAIISYVRIVVLCAIPIFNWMLALVIFLQYDKVRERMLETWE